jgi:DNA-binding NarL/FixJ family response regulator
MSRCLIVLADDHVMVRQGIRTIIEENPDMEVVAEASDGSELLEVLRNITAHLAILDITMPTISGIEAMKRIKAIYPQLKVLILTMHKGKELLEEAFAAGANGYLLKEDAPRELLNAIRTIQQGEVYVSPLIVPHLKDFYVQRHQNVNRPDLLTARETEVLKLISEGKSSKEIAAILFLSIRTVDNHRANIMRKLNMNKNTDLFKYALSKGYIDLKISPL